MKESKICKVDFTKIMVTNVDGTVDPVDVSKTLAQSIYSQTRECQEAEFAMRLYRDGAVEVLEEDKGFILNYAGQYPYAVMSAIEKALKNDRQNYNK